MHHLHALGIVETLVALGTGLRKVLHQTEVQGPAIPITGHGHDGCVVNVLVFQEGLDGLRPVPAPEIEAAVVAQIRTVLTSPESIASVVRHIQRNGGQVDEATTVMAMGRLNDVWDQLFPVERHRIANLMIERIDLVHIGEVQGIKVKWRELGWDALIGEFARRGIGAELVEVEA